MLLLYCTLISITLPPIRVDTNYICTVDCYALLQLAIEIDTIITSTCIIYQTDAVNFVAEVIWSKHSRNQNNENYNMEFQLYGRSKRLGSSYTNYWDLQFEFRELPCEPGKMSTLFCIAENCSGHHWAYMVVILLLHHCLLFKFVNFVTITSQNKLFSNNRDKQRLVRESA